MFCPQCRSEYREGFTRCNQCDADLVASLPAEEADGAPPQLVYEGSSEAEFGAIKAALQEEGIPFRDSIQTAGFLYSPIAIPRFLIWTHQIDLERVAPILEAIIEGEYPEQESAEASEEPSEE